jgi:hypothetical protein
MIGEQSPLSRAAQRRQHGVHTSPFGGGRPPERSDGGRVGGDASSASCGDPTMRPHPAPPDQVGGRRPPPMGEVYPRLSVRLRQPAHVLPQKGRGIQSASS